MYKITFNNATSILVDGRFIPSIEKAMRRDVRIELLYINDILQHAINIKEITSIDLLN